MLEPYETHKGRRQSMLLRQVFNSHSEFIFRKQVDRVEITGLGSPSRLLRPGCSGVYMPAQIKGVPFYHFLRIREGMD